MLLPVVVKIMAKEWNRFGGVFVSMPTCRITLGTDHFKVKDDEKSEGKDTLARAESTLLIKLITDVLLPKINNRGAIVKDNNAFFRDT